MFQHVQGVSFYFPLEAYLFLDFFGGFLFFGLGGVRGLSAFGSLAFRPGFGFLFSLASWFFGFWASWPLDFL